MSSARHTYDSAETAFSRAGARLALAGGSPSVTIPPPHYQWPLIEEEEEQAVLRQLQGSLSLHHRSGVVAELEDAFAAFHDVPFAMSTCSGTAALHAAYFALDLDPGDEALAPAYTHLSSVLPMLHANLVPVLCDVDPLTGNLDLLDASQRVSSRTRALVVTHQYGHVCEMDGVAELARERTLRVVEDCSHAVGATFRDRLAGTFGDVACFSLQAHKAVPAGEGGMLLTRDARIFERATMLGHFRQETAATSDVYAPFAETGYGLKNRIHPLGAALALAGMHKLPQRIDQWTANRAHFDTHAAGIPGIRVLPTAAGVSRGGYFRYLLGYTSAEVGGLPLDRYVKALRAEGVREVLPGNLAKPLHLTSFFQTLEDRMYRSGWPRRGDHVERELVYRAGDFPSAERFSAQTLQFPAFAEPSLHIIEAYCEAMRKVATHAEELLRYENG